ncbi:MAG TPA: exopolysaccharide biosynthesis protein [Cyanobacteria bacterium UBA8803]|nr:exopolysaccharide biosynthesis protein [Cyanobacteria bacterium UBA9273]HBL61524.1 exopolysaccharide biosynthesis protein [Cyanobacteria bacterium UBA8803]
MHLKFSQDIETLLKRLAHQPLSLQDILSETSERGFSLLITLLTLPFLFPVPPGVSSILGWSCFLVAVQMAVGRRSLWLPRQVARFRFPQWFIRQLLSNLKRVTRILEKLVCPRWPQVAENPKIWRWNGFCIAWLALLLMLPIPFTNPIPTIAILVLAIATLEEDGLLMCVGYGMTAVITLFFGAIAHAILLAPEWFLHLLE